MSSRPPKQEQLPANDQVVEVAPGILQTQLPVWMPGLGHVNCYVLLDDRGAAIVDPGLPGPQSWKALESRLAAADLKLRHVHTVIVTHSHPDHFGGAGRVAKEVGADVLTHAAFRTWWPGGNEADLPADVHDDVDAEDLATEHPWNTPPPWGGSRRDNLPLRRRLMFHGFRIASKLGLRQSYPPPTPSRRVLDGQVVELAGREWRSLHTPGHTIDHLCLHDEDSGILLTGDHVLPTITPHIAGMGSGRDPLKLFVASLDKVAELGVRLALPAHGQPFTDVAGRCESIKRHHEERMEVLRSASAALGPASVEQLMQELFRPERWGPMAASETYAHLEHLRLAGEADRHDRDGMFLYEVAPARAS